jgi:hypothetical protein
MNFKKDDEEIKESLYERQVDSIKVLRIVNQREPFILVEDEIKFEEIDHPVKRLSDRISREMINQNVTLDNEESKQAVPLPDGISSDEVQDPDVQRNLYSLLYCTEKLKKINNALKIQIQKGLPIPKTISKKMMLFTKQAADLESAIINKQVTFEQYMSYLKKSLSHDQLLLGYFNEIGNKQKAKIVEFRIECTQKEINQEVEEDELSDEE